MNEWRIKRKGILEKIHPLNARVIHGSDVKNIGSVNRIGIMFNCVPFTFEDPLYGEMEFSERGEIFFEIYSSGGEYFSLGNIFEIESWSFLIEPGMEKALNMSFSSEIRPWIRRIKFGKIIEDKVEVEIDMFLVSEDDYPLNSNNYEEHDNESKLFTLEATIDPMTFYDDRIDQSKSYKEYINSEYYDVSGAKIDPSVAYPDHRKSYIVPLVKRR